MILPHYIKTDSHAIQGTSEYRLHRARLDVTSQRTELAQAVPDEELQHFCRQHLIHSIYGDIRQELRDIHMEMRRFSGDPEHQAISLRIATLIEKINTL